MGLVIASENDDAHRSAFKWRFRNVKFNIILQFYENVSYAQFIVAYLMCNL